MIRNKLRKEADKKGLTYEINAFPYSECEKECVGADVILLGPQIRYNARRVKDLYPDIPVEVLGMTEYGKMDGEAILKVAMEAMKE